MTFFISLYYAPRKLREDLRQNNVDYYLSIIDGNLGK